VGIPKEILHFHESARTYSAQNSGASQSKTHLVEIFEQLMPEDKQRLVAFAEALLTAQVKLGIDHRAQ